MKRISNTHVKDLGSEASWRRNTFMNVMHSRSAALALGSHWHCWKRPNPNLRWETRARTDWTCRCRGWTFVLRASSWCCRQLCGNSSCSWWGFCPSSPWGWAEEPRPPTAKQRPKKTSQCVTNWTVTDMYQNDYFIGQNKQKLFCWLKKKSQILEHKYWGF